MNIKEAEILCQTDALDTPIVKRHESGAGWTATLTGTHQPNPLLETARGQVWVFKRLDAAVEGYSRLGLRKSMWCVESYNQTFSFALGSPSCHEKILAPPRSPTKYLGPA
nr:hypothetical protein [Methylomarinum sp. Ch1-1]MDP4522330.1 hypothetical protein [Methylomarinum sp. Ch1-1]